MHANDAHLRQIASLYFRASLVKTHFPFVMKIVAARRRPRPKGGQKSGEPQITLSLRLVAGRQSRLYVARLARAFLPSIEVFIEVCTFEPTYAKHANQRTNATQGGAEEGGGEKRVKISRKRQLSLRYLDALSLRAYG